ncbi:hypothetical protein KC331_g2640 [Hortaea werneckii]|nr:hypothetical protein KC331_g2640 [Hortaea werneckii]KAI7718285.1 hypothetical protein KC353_g3891 [Hortaea werneckii]
MSSNGYVKPYNPYTNGAPTTGGTNYNRYTQPSLYTGTLGDFSQQPQEAASANGQATMPFSNNYINRPMENSNGYPNSVDSYAAGLPDYTGAQQSVGTAATSIDLDAAEPVKKVQAQTQPRNKRAYTKKKPATDLKPGAATDQNATKAPKSANGRSKKTPKAKETADQATDRMMRAIENEEKREAKAEKQQQAKPPPLKKPRASKKGSTDPKPAQKQGAVPGSQSKLATKVQPEQGDLKEIRKSHQKAKPEAGVDTNTDPVDLEDDSNDSPHASEGWQRARPKVVYDETKIPRIMPDDYSQLPDGRVKKTYNGREKVTLVFGQYDFDDSTELLLDFFGSADGTVTLVLNGKLDLNKIDGDIMTDERDFPPADEEELDDPNGYIAPEDMLPTFWEHPEENAVHQQPTPDDSSKDSASPSGNLAKGTKRPRDEDTGSAGGPRNASKKQKQTQKQTLYDLSDDEGDGIYAPSGPGAPAKRKKAKQMNAKQQKEMLAHLRARNEMFERVKKGLPAQEPTETNEPARPFESRAAAATTVPAAIAGAEIANAEVTAPLIQLEESEESDADDDDPEYKRHPDYGKPIPETPAPQPSTEPALDDIDEAEFRRLFNEPDNLATSNTNNPATTNVVNGTGVQPAQNHAPSPGQASRKHSRSDDNEYEGLMPHKKIARKGKHAT